MVNWNLDFYFVRSVGPRLRKCAEGSDFWRKKFVKLTFVNDVPRNLDYCGSHRLQRYSKETQNEGER